MATTAERVREPDLLRTYLRALAREPGDDDHVRTCPNCGTGNVFAVDAAGWATCPSCKQYA